MACVWYHGQCYGLLDYALTGTNVQNSHSLVEKQYVEGTQVQLFN